MKTKKINRDEVRQENLSIPMTKGEKDAIQYEASRKGLTMSAWVRMVIAEKINEK